MKVIGLTAVPLLAGVISAFVVLGTLEYRDDPVGRPFLALMALIAAWALADAVVHFVGPLETKLLFMRLRTILGAFIPVVWILLTTRYAGWGRLLTRRRIGALLVEPVVFAVLVSTNDSHGLVWRDPHLRREPADVLSVTQEVGYLAHRGYAYLLIGAGIALLIWVLLREERLYRRQAGLLLVGAVFPVAANVAFALGASPVDGIDLTSSTFAVTGLVFALALFEFDLLDLRPVARQRAIEESGTGILVADENGRLIHANPTASEALRLEPEIGTDVTEFLDVETVPAVDGRVTRARIDGGYRFYDHRVTTLWDNRDEMLGHVVTLQDVTERRRYQQRLEVTNRILRHNLRNDVNKLTGWIERLESHVDESARPILENVAATAEDMATLSRQASHIESTLFRPDEDPVPVDLNESVGSVLAECRERWPEADVRYDPGGEYTVLAPGEELLATAVHNAVENAIEHNDSATPRIELRSRPAADDGDRIVLEVADDGPGIPGIERETLQRGTETALKHGSGLGLWVMRWVVAAAGGELAFRPNEPRGTVVVLRLPRADG